MSKNIAASKLQSVDEKTCLVVPYCQSLKSQHEMEIKDTICGALDLYDSDDAYKVKSKIEELKNNGEDVEKSDETTVTKSYRYSDPGQTGTTIAKKVLGQLFSALLILQWFPYARGNPFEYGKQGQQKCISSPTLVYNSSNASFTDLTSCNHMLHQLQCHSVKACIPNNGGKLKTVCTDNLCLTDHACPELTVTSDQRMVVQSKDDKCMDCRKYDDLKSRLQELKNIGKECLPLATKSIGTYRPMFNPVLMAVCLVICMYICRMAFIENVERPQMTQNRIKRD